MYRTSVMKWCLACLAAAAPAAQAAVSHQIHVHMHVIRAKPATVASTPDQVILPGDSLQVELAASFPADGYALAAADFELGTDMPGWTRVSTGTIEGGVVSGVQVGQPHVGADTANPIPIWAGTYVPVCYSPHLLQMQVTPKGQWYYPNAMTASPAEYTASPSRRSLLINPVAIGDVLVAPGAGTAIDGGAGLDILIGNTGGDRQAIIIGMLLPAVQRVRMEPGTMPTDLVIEAETGSESVPTGTVRFTFSEAINPGTYQLHPQWEPADYYDVMVHTVGDANARSFAGQTVRIRIQATNNQSAGLIVGGIPNVFSTGTTDEADGARVVCRFDYDRPVEVVTPSGTVLMAGAIEVHAVANNLKQIGLGTHTVEMHHTGGANFSFADGSVTFISSY